MENEYQGTHIYKPIMAGLMAGIVATVLNIFYDVIYRESTGFPLTVLINVATIIFGTLLLFTIAGSVFAAIDKYSKQATVIYIIFSLLFTLLCIYLTLHIQRSDDPVLTLQFRHLLLGIVIICGVISSFLIPYLSKNETNYI